MSDEHRFMPGEVAAEQARRYTLDEARAVFAREECSMHGHDFDVVVALGGLEPVSLICSRCGRTWTVSA